MTKTIESSLRKLKIRFIVIAILFSFIFVVIVRGLLSEIFTLEDKIENNNFILVSANYLGGSNPSNNVDWIGERSFSLPAEAKGKQCYLLGSKLSGTAGGTLRGFLGKVNNSGVTYNFSENYEAEVNPVEAKIEITKRNGNQSTNLSELERNNLYFSIVLLCK